MVCTEQNQTVQMQQRNVCITFTRVDDTGIEVVKCSNPSLKVMSFPLVSGYQASVSQFSQSQASTWTTDNKLWFTAIWNKHISIAANIHMEKWRHRVYGLWSRYGRHFAGIKGKVFPYSLPSVGPGADPGVQAVSPQVMWSESRHIPSSTLPLLSARPAFTFVALTRWRYL